MKGKTEKTHKKFKEKLVETIDIPKEIGLNLPKVTIIGSTDIHVENVKGVIEYTEESIKLNSSIGIIMLSGSNFKIMDITTEDMYIEGKIKHIDII